MNKQYKEYGRSIAMGALAGVTMAVIFAAGFFARDFIQLPNIISANSGNYLLLDEVQNLLERQYLRELPDQTALQYAAIRGVLESLGDRNTFFIEPPVAKSESDALAGTYGGIGVQIQRSEMGEFVLIPFEDSPALAAGIEEGDILVSINGEPVDLGTQQDAVDQMMRGEVKDGNGVEITVLKSGTDLFTAFIEFDVINVPSVLWRALSDSPEIGYVQILRFTNRTPDELDEALIELQDSEISALILDLRDNGGGLLQESIQVADAFLDDGVVLYERTNNSERTFTTDTGGQMTDLPLVVLVNGGTASASELVAGALQDRERGILIGQKTFGKGTIQQIFSLSDQSSIHVTSAEWFTPNRNALDGVGLEPTISMIPDDNGRDVEIGEAIRYLRETLAEAEAAQGS